MRIVAGLATGSIIKAIEGLGARVPAGNSIHGSKEFGDLFCISFLVSLRRFDPVQLMHHLGEILGFLL